MLIKSEHLQAIARGEVTVAFRRWKRPTVRAGGSLRTRVGVLAIDSVEVVSERSISTADARRAGFGGRAELLGALRSRGGDATEIYCIRLQLQGEDPRIALRQQSRLSRDDVVALRARLDRYDTASQRGPWTPPRPAVDRRPARDARRGSRWPRWDGTSRSSRATCASSRSWD